jgi:hypothetical protein
VLVPILSDPRLTEPRSPGHTRNVELYNGLLRAVARDAGATFVEPESVFSAERRERGDLFFPDGYHLTAEGCSLLAQRVAELVERTLSDVPRPGR